MLGLLRNGSRFGAFCQSHRLHGTLRAVSHQFAAIGALTPPRTPVDRTNPLHPFHLGESGPSLEAQLLVHRLLRQVALENTFQSCVTLRTELAAKQAVPRRCS
jgi:hypothetical protein